MNYIFNTGYAQSYDWGCFVNGYMKTERLPNGDVKVDAYVEAFPKGYVNPFVGTGRNILMAEKEAWFAYEQALVCSHEKVEANVCTSCSKDMTQVLSAV